MTSLGIFEPWQLGLLGGVLGLVVGSYLATLLHRWPLGLSVNRGRSGCDSCGRRLSWWEVAPLAGFVLTAGHCRTCGAPISHGHSLIEAACGAAGTYFFALGLPALAPLTWLLLILALFDARHLWLPNPLVAGLAITACIAPPWVDCAGWGDRLLGAVAGFGALWLVGTGFRLITGREGLGGGDPKLFGAIGLWTGALALPGLMLAASVIGLGHAGLRLRRGDDGKTLKLPLGSYIAVAAMALAGWKPIAAMAIL